MSPVTRDQLAEWGRRGGRARAATCNMRELGSTGGRATVARHGSAHMAATGALGAARTRELYGDRYLSDLVRCYRLQHPSDLETIVEAVLLELHQAGAYEREAFICDDLNIVGDFVFRARRLVVYADGAHWHECNGHAGDRAAHDAEVDTLLAGRGWHVVRLSEKTIKFPYALKAALRRALREAPGPEIDLSGVPF